MREGKNYSRNMYSNLKSTNTLDLIDECLNMVHNSRKSFALANSRKMKEQTRKIRGIQSAKYDKGTEFEFRSSSNHEGTGDTFDSKSYYEDIRHLEDMATTFSSPPVEPAPYQKPPDVADVAAQQVEEK